jgi:hypothetical protein
MAEDYSCETCRYRIGDLIVREGLFKEVRCKLGVSYNSQRNCASHSAFPQEWMIQKAERDLVLNELIKELGKRRVEKVGWIKINTLGKIIVNIRNRRA